MDPVLLASMVQTLEFSPLTGGRSVGGFPSIQP